MTGTLSLRSAANVVLLLALLPVVVIVSRRIIRKTGSSTRSAADVVSLSLVFGLGTVGYFVPGDLMGWDAPNHVARTWIFADAIAHLEILPAWTNRWYLGFPLSLYYGSLYYLTTGLVTLTFGGAVFFATKVSLWILHALSGITMFALARQVTNSSSAALFAATFYVMSFQHLAIIMQAGALPLSIIFLVLPAALSGLERLLSHYTAGGSVLIAFPLALLLSAMLLSHVQYGVFAIATVVGVGLCRIAMKPRLRSMAVLRATLLTAIFCALFCSWFMVPLVLESRHVMLGRDTISSIFGDISRLVTVDAWADVLRLGLRSNTSPTMVVFYFGLLPLGVALGAWLCMLRSQTSPDVAYLVGWLTALFYSVMNIRFVVVLFTLTVVLSAISVAALEQTWKRRGRESWALVYVVLVVSLLLDVGPMAVPPRFDTFKEPVPSIHGDPDAPNRMLSVYPTEVTLWSHMTVIGSGLATPLGGIPQEAPSSYPYVAAIASKATIELVDNAGSLTRATMDALRLLNIRFVRAPQTDVLVEVVSPSPIWFSSRLIRRDQARHSPLEKDTWQALRSEFERRQLDYRAPLNEVEGMKLDPSQPIARGGFLAEKPSLGAASEARDGDSMDCHVIQHLEGHSYVKIRYSCSRPGFALLAYSFFPYLSVVVDDRVVGHAFRSSLNLTGVEVPAGEHTISLLAYASPLRRALFMLSVASLVGGGLWYGTRRSGRRSRLPRDLEAVP
jgi:hypothetical protein